MADEKKDKGLIGKVIDVFSSRDEKEALEKAQQELEAAKKEAEEAKVAAEKAADEKAKARAEEAEKRRKEMAEAYALRKAAIEAAKAEKVVAHHDVQAGETLSHIAQKYYGNASRPYWEVIYKANKDVIGDNPNIIKVGQSLVILDLPADLKK